MKIVLLNLGSFIGAKAGTEKVFCSMSNAFVQKGHEVIALFMENKIGEPPFFIDDRVKLINTGIGFNRKLPLLKKIVRAFILDSKARHKYDAEYLDVKIGNRLKSFINKENPDIIISYSANATRIVKGVVCPDCPVITMFHFNPEHILDKCFAKTLESLEECECIQVLDEDYIEGTKKYIIPQNIVYIPNVVPKSECIEFGCTKERKIINVGRVDRIQKRQHLIVEAFALIADSFPNWSVEFWGATGNGSYYNHCLKLIQKYGLGNRVKFCGVTDNVERQLNRASIFAFPSAFEGFPLALTEAMAAGLPVIGYKSCPSVKKLIKDDKNGILCDDGIKPLAKALAELCGDREKRIRFGKQAKIDMEQYSPENVWGIWEKLIEKTVEEYRQKNKYIMLGK